MSRKKFNLNIVIATYNSGKFTKELIQQIDNDVNNLWKYQMQIIIIDDCSTDDTVLVIEDLIKNIENIAISFIQLEKNTGSAGTSLNKGLELVSDGYVHFIDGDDLVNTQVYNDFFEKDKFRKSDIDIYDFSVASFNQKISDIYYINEILEQFEDEYPYTQSQRLFKGAIRSYLYGCKFISAKLIKENGLFFDVKTKFQDKDIMIKIYNCYPKIAYNLPILLYYRCGRESISTGLSLDRFIDNFELTKKLLDNYPQMIIEENMYLLKMVANSNIQDAQKVIHFLSKNHIHSHFERPKSFDYLSWQFYLTDIALRKKDVKAIVTIISNYEIAKSIIGNSDYKVFSVLASKDLQQIMLQKLFIDLKKCGYNFRDEIQSLFSIINYRRCCATNCVIEKKVLIDIIIDIHSELKNQLEYLAQNKYPQHIRTQKDIENFFKSYIKTYRYKYTTIMISYNREKDVFNAINSFIKNEYSNSELIIVDNNSEFELYEKIRKYVQLYENIKLIRLNENEYCGARNHAIKVAQGEYISFIDDDDTIVPDYYSRADKFIIESFDVVRFNMQWIDEKSEKVAELYYATADGNYIDDNITKKNIASDYHKYRTTLSSSCLSFINIRLLSAKSFIPNIVFEDTLFFQEISLTMDKLYVINQVLYMRQSHQTSITKIDLKIETKKKQLYFDSAYIVFLGNVINAKKSNIDDSQYRRTVKFYYTLMLKRVFGEEILLEQETLKRLKYIEKAQITNMVDYIDKSGMTDKSRLQLMKDKYN